VKSTIVLFTAGLALLLGGQSFARAHVKHAQAKPQVSINKATLKELEMLPGVGVATAKRVIAYREKNGKFKSLKGLLAVRGMSPHKLEHLGDRVGL
jgi:competence ComEA-like helix-hairpin-helix protein